MGYQGTIIEESLVDKSILKEVRVLKTKVESVNERHKTPWISQWTLHAVEIPEAQARPIAEKISLSLDPEHSWYADYKNDDTHYIIFRNKVFCIDRYNKEQYDEAKRYGLALGIPEYQVNFQPKAKDETGK